MCSSCTGFSRLQQRGKHKLDHHFWRRKMALASRHMARCCGMTL
jgi:hypothetical protein